ncbi:MAG: bifunctional histidinol-phosphatase/imidazoleglycerol-phosphate dehydratase HisB [Bacteroidota bacterium]
MKKVLFLDRDGTLILEPDDYQVDDLSKVHYYPKVFRYLSKIVEELDYEIVMITNQDGLGTDSYPEDTFWPAHNQIIKTFEGEGIIFEEVFIDRTFAHENAPTRKPRTGLLTKYSEGDYDLTQSIVIGDRLTDMELAKNLGGKGIWLNNEPELGATETEGGNEVLFKEVIALTTTDWEAIYHFLSKQGTRTHSLTRTTKETSIQVTINLDGSGQYNNQTGIGFFDHMLDQLSKHSESDLTTMVEGDLHIDEHHTIEDTALALGTAMKEALGDKKGIERYGFSILPMDEALAQVAIDFSGRPCLVWDVDFTREKVGGFPTEMVKHFFKSLSDTALCNINIKAYGENDHHIIEIIFKAFAKAMRQAKKIVSNDLPSTKGVL